MRTWAEISKSSLINNLNEIRQTIGEDVQLMLVVKANAYGHGIDIVSKVAEKNGVNWLGVATIKEALEIRDSGVELPVLTFFEPEENEVQELIERNISFNLFNEDKLPMVSKISSRVGKPARCHIKVNTGMNRLGVSSEKAGKFIRRALNTKGITVEGIWSHLATAETRNNNFVFEQLQNFNKAISGVELKKIPFLHVANSGAALYYKETRFNMVRVGIAAYGYFPSFESPKVCNLKPVLSLKSKIAAIQELEPGEGVSYGLKWRAERKSKIAICPMGYADGLPRTASGKFKVLAGTKKVNSVGAICMDQFAVDITGFNVRCGDVVTLISEDLNAESLARSAGTITYEILSGLGARIPRVLTD